MILAIESSCDETSLAVVDHAGRLRSNIVASQVALHAEYGGVFPEVAARAHIEAIDAVYTEALAQAQLSLDEIELIAVTRGPGLVGSLLVGINFAKGLALATRKELIGINHLEGHIYSLWVDYADEIEFPALNLIVSGGHTELVLMPEHGRYQHLGGTIDDAAGEAFDKVGRLLNLPYPGGPAIQEAAKTGNADAYQFPRAMLHDDNFDFSFSGLKTAVMRTVRPSVKGRKVLAGEQSLKEGEMREGLSVADVAASFQAAVIDVLVKKTHRAAEAFGAKTILLSGGVSANQGLRQGMAAHAPIPVYYPDLKLCTDNAGMIAMAAYYRAAKYGHDTINFDVLPTWPLDEL